MKEYSELTQIKLILTSPSFLNLQASFLKKMYSMNADANQRKDTLLKEFVVRYGEQASPLLTLSNIVDNTLTHNQRKIDSIQAKIEQKRTEIEEAELKKLRFSSARQLTFVLGALISAFDIWHNGGDWYPIRSVCFLIASAIPFACRYFYQVKKDKDINRNDKIALINFDKIEPKLNAYIDSELPKHFALGKKNDRPDIFIVGEYVSRYLRNPTGCSLPLTMHEALSKGLKMIEKDEAEAKSR